MHMLTTRITPLTRPMVLRIVCASFVMALFSCGCSSEQVPPERTAKVAGTVTLKGKAVKGGTLMLMDLQNGSSGQAALDKSGKFEMTDAVPPGEYTVFLAGTRVPEKYQSETSSDYKVTVTEGDNELKIDLK